MQITQIILILIASASCHLKNEANNQDDQNKSYNSVSEFVGFVDFDLTQNAENMGTIEILYENGNPYVTITGGILNFEDKSFNLKEGSEDEISILIGTEFFEPEYDLMVAKCFGVSAETYTVLIGKKLMNVKKGTDVNFFGFEDFFSDQLISTDKEPVLEFPREGSELAVPNYEEYAFEVVGMKGDWLQVKILSDIHGDVRPNMGWVKWRENDDVLIDIMYSL